MSPREAADYFRDHPTAADLSEDGYQALRALTGHAREVTALPSEDALAEALHGEFGYKRRAAAKLAGRALHAIRIATGPVPVVVIGSELHTIGDVERAGAGAWVEGADGRRGVVAAALGSLTPTGVVWSDGGWTERASWPMTVRGLPGVLLEAPCDLPHEMEGA